MLPFAMVFSMMKNPFSNVRDISTYIYERRTNVITTYTFMHPLQLILVASAHSIQLKIYFKQ